MVTVWHGMAWYGMVWYGMVWYTAGTVQYIHRLEYTHCLLLVGSGACRINPETHSLQTVCVGAARQLPPLSLMAPRRCCRHRQKIKKIKLRGAR